MNLNYITQDVANLVMDAMLCSWMELEGNFDENRVDEGVEWVKNAFVRFCDVSEINVVQA